jgi:D-sedoheptulose 7-phosphate isomerase|tara:strand:- start:4738 stop:5331 length:594 start_codon:yes stop_codon:yes gene_type:complete
MAQRYKQYVVKYFEEIKHIIATIETNHIEQMAEKIEEIKTKNQRLFVFGVGGSAANASHAVNDFRKILGIECYSALDNVSELTARINDDGWDTSLVNWVTVSKLNSSDNILIFSVGGGSDTTSQNLVQLMRYAKEVGASILSIVSRDGGYAKEFSDICVQVPVVCESRTTPHAEEWQGILWHMLVSAVVEAETKNED